MAEIAFGACTSVLLCLVFQTHRKINKIDIKRVKTRWMVKRMFVVEATIVGAMMAMIAKTKSLVEIICQIATTTMRTKKWTMMPGLTGMIGRKGWIFGLPGMNHV